MVLVDTGVVRGRIAGWYVVRMRRWNMSSPGLLLWCWAGGSVAKEQFVDSVFKIYFTSAEGLHAML